jgi:hypothetical protein
LTEPQAVAAFTLCEEGIFEVCIVSVQTKDFFVSHDTAFQNGDSVLIVDAGGGTVVR